MSVSKGLATARAHHEASTSRRSQAARPGRLDQYVLVRYKTAAAVRRALEERFRQQSLEGGQRLPRLRKMVALDRFLERLAKKEWIVSESRERWC
jgi:hypothetical protein